jgi:glycosyltransferase involved in cell wall biosynthesis
MTTKPNLLIVSSVYPFPGFAGQQQRVLNKLKAFNVEFTTTFVTNAPAASIDEVHRKLLEYCNNAIVFPSLYGRSLSTKLGYRLRALIYNAKHGLKLSNYIINKVEFPPERLKPLLLTNQYDGALFEYWHAVDAVDLFVQNRIPTILDMHDILWKSRTRQLDTMPFMPPWWKKRSIELYKFHEESAWKDFDALIAINSAEADYVRNKVSEQIQIFYAPMGVDLTQWPYAWSPVQPPRIVYYGGLGSVHNQQDALFCAEKIMPIIWAELPDTELWLVGSNPPPLLKALTSKDSRIKVTGYVQDVQDVLKTATLALCPWTGTYGFRSRLIEMMSIGIPIVASSDAVYGMDLDSERGLFLRDNAESMAEMSLHLLNHPLVASEQSRLAHDQVKTKFDFANTYGRLALELAQFIKGTASRNAS